MDDVKEVRYLCALCGLPQHRHPHYQYPLGACETFKELPFRVKNALDRLISEREAASKLANSWNELPPEIDNLVRTEINLFAMYLYAKGLKKKLADAEGTIRAVETLKQIQQEAFDAGVAWTQEENPDGLTQHEAFEDWLQR